MRILSPTALAIVACRELQARGGSTAEPDLAKYLVTAFEVDQDRAERAIRAAVARGQIVPVTVDGEPRLALPSAREVAA